MVHMSVWCGVKLGWLCLFSMGVVYMECVGGIPMVYMWCMSVFYVCFLVCVSYVFISVICILCMCVCIMNGMCVVRLMLA